MGRNDPIYRTAERKTEGQYKFKDAQTSVIYYCGYLRKVVSSA
jgi:hypothetical protein